MSSAELIAGIYAASPTPIAPDGSADRDSLIAHCRWLLDNGCAGIAPLGTTGEANSLSFVNRLAIIEAIAAARIPLNRVIVGTGSCAVGDTVRLTQHALEHGYPNVLVLPPFYYKGVSDDGLFAYFSTVIERLADPRLRLNLYHFPQMSAVPISLGLIKRLRAAFGDTVAGIKDSSGDWSNTKSMIETVPGFRVFSGSEQFLSENLALGGAGCISATTNVTAPIAARLLAGRNRGGDDPQREITEIRLALQKFPLVQAVKKVLHWRTGDAAWTRILPPLSSLSLNVEENLRKALAQFSLFGPDACSN
ncbi:MAG: dihydrodipicolinate synthase family protein [Rhodospirillales bacterium]|nr:dihydrodipicolinate synthase family protein [Rhodospirillales bacterium]